jgi:hypothetical protein
VREAILSERGVSAGLEERDEKGCSGRQTQDEKRLM